MSTPTTRKPVYPDNAKRRVRLVSVPNGLWQIQEHVGRHDGADTRVMSGWAYLGRPDEFDVALGRLKVAAGAAS